MVAEGLLKQVGKRPVEYFQATDGGMNALLDDDDALTYLIWPGQRPPEAPPDDESDNDDFAVGAHADAPTDRELLEANLKLSSALFEHAQVMTASLEGVRNELAELRKLWE
jgi:hypothetical protein